MCGVGGTFLSPFFLTAYSPTTYPTADRRPIDPPPIVQLRVIDKARKNLPSPSPSPPPHPQPSHPHAHTHESSGPLDTSMLTPAGFGAGPFLQNPYYFMFASLAKPDDDTELHWMKVRSVASLLGLVFHILYFSPFLSSRLSRTERRVAPRDLWCRPCITSRTRRMTTETLVSSFSRI